MAKKKKISKARFVNAKITSTISITLVLLLLGVTILLLFLGNGISTYVKENMSFSVMLSNDITESGITKIRKNLDAMPFVNSSRFISKEEAKEQLIKELGEDPEELLGYNPAQDVIEIYLKSEYTNSDSLESVTKLIKAENNVDDLLYQQEAVDIINNNLTKITTVLLFLALVLLFISFTLIRNTIRLTIYSKRFLINTMQLVGATGRFIRRPFVANTVFIGVIAGIIADALILGSLYYFSKEFAQLSSIISVTDLIIIFSSVILMGVVITSIATILSVNHFLKMERDSMFYV
ncbi:MAG: permease-like cell division protein FtsX [Dysgonamonadaceae bacterium]|jgi:cell division transport system permease protein|nr:permease-like cell division protein FtsX [Dysgonamonadaceae bacterium]